MAGTVRIAIFGGFQLTTGSRGPVALRSRRQQALLAWLVVHRDRPPSRAQLAAALWPETTEAQARTNLRNLIFSLRRAVPGIDEWASLEGPAPVILDGVESDLGAFLEAIEDARAADADRDWRGAREAYARAVDAYAGDLLPDIDDPWLDPYRERFRGMLHRTLERLVELHEQARDYRGAVDRAERLLSLDPTCDVVAVTLVRLHALAGDTRTARASWDAFVQRLDDELGVSPDPTVAEGVMWLLEGTVDEGKDDAGRLPLVGREDEWNRLRTAVQHAVEGHPSLVLIEGEAGIGKTRLAEEVVEWSRRQGIRAAVAHAYAAESGLAYGPAAEWLRSPALRDTVARLDDGRLVELRRIVPDLAPDRRDLPPPGPMTEGWQRQRLFEAMARAVVGDEQPVLLVLDDLQWCDAETLEWLHYLLRSENTARLAMLATWRAGEAREGLVLDDLLQSTQRRHALVRVELGPLDQVHATTLASIATGGVPMSPDIAGRFFTETEGSPLFIVEMARAGAVPGVANDRNESPEAEIPATVVAAIHSRLVHLSATAMDAARVASVIGRPFPAEIVATVLDRDETELIDALDELTERRLLRQDERGVFSYAHDKVRQVVEATLSPARRRLMHRHLAAVLESMQGAHPAASSGMIAMHHERAGNQKAAASWYLRAAAEARRVFADADAERLYALAIENFRAADDAGEGIFAAREGLADVLHRLGKGEDSLRQYRELLLDLPQVGVVDRARVLRKISRLHRLRRRVDDARSSLGEALDALGATILCDGAAWWSEWIETRLEQVHVAYFDGREEEIAALLPGLEDAVAKHGNPVQRAEVSRSTMQHAFLRDRYTGTDETLRLAQDRHARSVQSGLEPAMAATGFALGFTLLQRRDPEARTHLQAALERARTLGDLELQARCLTYLAMDARLRGEREGGATALDQVDAVTSVIGLPEYRAAALANRAWIARCDGRAVKAEELAAEAVRMWEAADVFYPFKWVAYTVLLGVAAISGDLERGVDAAKQMLHPSQQRLPDDMAEALDAVVFEGTREALVRAMRKAESAGYL